jgi:hypothetical protein
VVDGVHVEHDAQLQPVQQAGDHLRHARCIRVL